ncbi:unnamed protein product [Ectocarpus fasciculatus]
MGGPDNIDRSSIGSSGGMSNHDIPLPSSGSNGDIHKRVTRASAASATAGSHANNGNSSATGKAPSSSAHSPADTNGHSSCSQDAHRRPPALSASTSSSSSSSSPKPAAHHHPNSKWTWAGYLLLLAVTKYTLPDELHTSAPTLKHVWFYGWVTALSTGVGAAPLILTHDLGKAMLAYGNAIAAGMMLSASFSLVSEGATVVEPEGFTAEWGAMFAACLGAPWARVVLGVAAGLVFILSTKKVLDNYEDIKLGELHGIDAKKVLLIVFVMTLHSFSEGVGIGVSFGGDGGARLGFLISATLAVHNVPEGLAVALVLNPRGVSKLNTVR